MSKATWQTTHSDLSVSNIVDTEDIFGSYFDSKDDVEMNICSDKSSHHAVPYFLIKKTNVAKDFPPKDKI